MTHTTDTNIPFTSQWERAFHMTRHTSQKTGAIYHDPAATKTPVKSCDCATCQNLKLKNKTPISKAKGKA